ncbi:MAG: peptide deformylase [Bdellovibrionota bacterium]
MIREICRMGHPVLRMKAAEVSRELLLSDEFRQLVVDLRDSMKHYGGIGIAAPQIGVSLQAAIIELGSSNRYGEEVSLPFTVFVNPKLEFLTDESQGFWEGCLSVPGLRGYVERPKKLKINFLNEKGEEKEIIAEGFLSTVIQHELDHLFGVLYVDRIKDMSLLSYQEEYDEFQSGKEDELE